MDAMSFSEIDNNTGFASGDRFSSENEVRAYFTEQNLVNMMGGVESPVSQLDLDAMADVVVKNKWWMESL